MYIFSPTQKELTYGDGVHTRNIPGSLLFSGNYDLTVTATNSNGFSKISDDMLGSRFYLSIDQEAYSFCGSKFEVKPVKPSVRFTRVVPYEIESISEPQKREM